MIQSILIRNHKYKQFIRERIQCCELNGISRFKELFNSAKLDIAGNTLSELTTLCYCGRKRVEATALHCSDTVKNKSFELLKGLKAFYTTA